MKITSIKPQVKNPERASIFVEGKYTFSLSLTELVNERLRIDQEISEVDLKRLKKISEDGKLKMRAMEWVLNRPRSLREFKDYLFRKKAELDITQSLIEDFQSRGYLSDLKFAEWLIDVRRRGGKSDRAIRSELMKKGVNREVIDETLHSDSESELTRLKQLISKKSKLPRYKADRLKLKQYLLRQGFNYQDIKNLLG